jgi:cyclopropane fatty-acyl-phospholipid synthase-like methyltransferase
MVIYSQLDNSAPTTDINKFFDFNDREFETLWKEKRIPMETFIEAYFDAKVDVKSGVDLHKFLKENRKSVFRFNFTRNHAEFFLKKFLVQAVRHDKVMDEYDVATTYNIGNDFYNSFLGETMVYTSGIFNSENDSLEQAQENKMHLVANKINMKKGEKHLDIGCGWGKFVVNCSKNYGTDSYGVTIAKEQVEWGNNWIESGDSKSELNGNARLEKRDYRDIDPKVIYDKITCLEMAEHVGVKNFQKFCRQVNGSLHEDGLFYLQICGLRPTWHFEDLVWGLFMAKYIFPAADASCPISWVTCELEQAGFEIHSVENVSTHYVETIHRWYLNWCDNEAKIVDKYGLRPYRVWKMFLAWSVIIGSQGTSQCYQIVCNKNRNDYNRRSWMGSDLANVLLRSIKK